MATYVLPQVLVFQDFTIAPAVDANLLSAFISGGNAFLTRTDDADEKVDGLLDYYDNSIDEAYSWPNRPAGAVVDQSYTKVYIENALLQYFSDALSSGNVITRLANYNNRITAASVNWATNGSYARDSDLYDRDVAPGDVIRVRATPSGGDPVVLWTSVKDVIAEEVDAIVAAATKDSANPAAQVAAQAVTDTGSIQNCVTATAGSAYDGVGDGHVSETYVVTVIESSTGGDFPLARLNVKSASGTDDHDQVQAAAHGAATTIGSRGLTLTFSTDDTAACSTSADNDGVTDNDLIKDQQWTVAVDQLWNSPDPTSNAGTLATYTSRNSTTYIIEVSRGGLYADALKPQISVTTSNGVDQSGPHTVSAAAADVTIGQETVTIQFDKQGLNKGDRYYIPVTGIVDGPMHVLELTDNIDEDVLAGDEVGVELYIRNTMLEVPQNRAGFAPVTNWDQSETQITINDSIIAYDSSWTDAGVALPLDVYSCSSCSYGQVFVTYRAWDVTVANVINSISDVGDIDDIPGSLTPDNPLKWGVYKALTNNNGTPVLYIALADPTDPDEWDEVLDLAQSRDDIHAMVPLTRDATVQGLFVAHVDSMSSAQNGLWRTVWFSLAGVPEIPLVATGSTVPGHTTATTSDGEECLVVIEDDPQSTGTQYTIVRNAAGNGKFITNGVLAGDIVRAQYVGDGFGNYVYSEYVVDLVQSEEQLRLKTGPGVPISVPAKIEIWRNLTLTEEAAEIARDAGAFYDRRVLAVWPDQIESSGTIQEGFHLAAALAGLSSGVLPQQSLTRVGVGGFSDVQRTSRFSKSQLDKMALSGTWIVMQSPDGNIFTRQAVTTGSYEDINQREEMLTRNVDSISYRFKDFFEPYIGVTNVTPSMEAVLTAGITTLIDVLQVERFTVNLGGQLIGAVPAPDANGDSGGWIQTHPIFKDRYVSNILLTVPYALNNIEIHLVV